MAQSTCQCAGKRKHRMKNWVVLEILGECKNYSMPWLLGNMWVRIRCDRCYYTWRAAYPYAQQMMREHLEEKRAELAAAMGEGADDGLEDNR